MPADLDTAEEIGFRPGHFEQALRLEIRALAENPFVGLEPHARAAPVLHLAQLFEGRDWVAPLEDLPVERLAPRDFHFEPFRQRVDDGNADPMQAARGLIGFLIEFAARVQHGHDDFERRFLRKFLMRIDRKAAPIVDHGEKTRGLEADIDEGSVAGNRLVHRIVEDFREKMMERGLAGAADIHARPPPDRLQPLQHLDRGGGIAEVAKRFVVWRPAVFATPRLAGPVERAAPCVPHCRKDRHSLPCAGLSL